MSAYEEFIDAILPGADEFQRIAIAECFRETEGVVLCAETDEKFSRLGAIVLEVLEMPETG